MSNAVSLIEEAYTVHYDLIYNTCYNRLKNHEDAEDALQDTFELALRYFHTYDDSKAAIHTWLNRIANNRCSLLLRHIRNRGMSVEVDDDTLGNYEHELDKEVMLEKVKDEINNVSEPVRRSCLYLYFIDKASHDEIVSLMGVKRRTMYQWVYRFLEEIKEKHKL